jgi:hypothetical protein
MGTVGALTFLGVVCAICSNVRSIRRAYRENEQWDKDFLYHLANGMGIALFLLLFEGFFGHNLFRFSWLWYGGFLIIARYCVQQRLSEAGMPEMPNASWQTGWAAAPTSLWRPA